MSNPKLLVGAKFQGEENYVQKEQHKERKSQPHEGTKYWIILGLQQENKKK